MEPLNNVGCTLADEQRERDNLEVSQGGREGGVICQSRDKGLRGGQEDRRGDMRENFAN